MSKFSTTGALQLTAAQLIIGLNLVLAKSMLAHLSVVFLLLIRFGLGMLFGLVFNGLRNKTLLQKRDATPLTITDHSFLFAQALTAGFLFNLLMMIGLQYTSAATAGLICSIIPAAIAALSVWLLKDRMTGARLLSIALAFCGLIILNIHGASLQFAGKNLLGQFVILLSVIPEALFTIIAKLHRTGMSSLNKVIYMNFYNFVMFIPIALWYTLMHGLPVILHADWYKLSLYGLNSVLFFLLWYKGLEKTSAMVSGLYTAIAPCSTILLAYLFLGEPIHLAYIITFVFVFASIIIGSGLLKRKPFVSIF